MQKPRIKRKGPRPSIRHTTSSNGAQSPSQLLAAVIAMVEQKKAETTKSPDDYLYAIYTRRSTDDPKKQRKTLQDQLDDCRALAKQNNLKVAKVFTESVSAKEPGIRRQFREMMKGLEHGRYDGIIAWAPDRLARNMREGGEIIDLLDQTVIKDLRFCSMTFMNTPEGKMMLGIAFVMAKQWVESHSERMKSAVDRRTKEGVNLGKPKHGYYNDNMGCMRPDGENWQLIRGVFDRRMQGMGQKEIAAWLKAEGYPRKTNHDRPLVVVDTAFISSLLQETVYAGILVYGDEIVDLRTMYDFVPMVTEEEFDRVRGKNGLKKHLKAMRGGLKRDRSTNLLNEMVICEGCEAPMRISITNKKEKGVRYLYYRCNTLNCPNQKDGERPHVRARVIIEAARKWIRENPLLLEVAHGHYVKEMGRIAGERKKEIANTLRSLEQTKHRAEARLLEIKKRIEEMDDPSVASLYIDEIKKEKAQIRDVSMELKKLRGETDAMARGLEVFADFVEQAQKLSEKLQKENTAAKLDRILRKVFSNFYVKDKKVTKITQNSPWRELCLDADSAMVTQRSR